MNAAFLNAGPAVAPGTDSVKRTRDLVRLLSLEAVTVDRPRLVCRWHRDIDGRLACRWEPEALSACPVRLPDASP
jgi:hypothetical protein